MRKKTYYTLLVQDQGQWEIHFGDYDRETVEAELDDVKDSGFFKRSELKIITTADDQASIMAGLARANEKEQKQ